MSRARRGTPVLLALCLLLAACAGIPSSGMTEVPDRAVAPADAYVHVRVPGPEPGLDPRTVVARFLAASAGFDEDFATARRFLSASAATSWQPSAGILVVDALTPEKGGDPTSPQQVERGTALGRLDGGRYVPLPAPVKVRLTFSLVDAAVQGGSAEWRVGALSGAPVEGAADALGEIDLSTGLVLDRASVAYALAPLNLWWLTPDHQRLVPEPVFLPQGRGSLATALVQLLLAGPPTRLQGAVTTAVPRGTVLQQPVTLDTSTAQVQLSGLDALSAAQRELLGAQLSATLTQSDLGADLELGIDKVALATGVGAPVDVTGLAAGYDPAPKAEKTVLAVRLDKKHPGVRAGQVVVATVGGSSATAYSGLRGRALSFPVRTGVGRAGVVRSAALGGTGRRELVLDDGTGLAPRTVYTGRGSLAAPSFDGTGWLWSGDTATGQLLVVAPGSTEVGQVPLDLGALAQRYGVPRLSLKLVHVAPDGARVAVVLTTGKQRDVVVVLPVVRREATPVPLLGEALPLASTGDQVVRDVEWAQPSSVALLTSNPGSKAQPSFRVVPVGRVSSTVDETAGAETVAVSANPDQPPVLGLPGTGGQLQLLKGKTFGAGLTQPSFQE
ncbi:sporulation and spore germination protein [Motilibacter rhizosphaerae]|uniref:Sporulation and spore germination protein n=1 Tax=Motilibacter rhizosphaerae TaxID=598652 RepID=A0A4Q7NTK6_9ACTN|nr:LpqB family beta-propeller domain-containing protein [Motilibacter rhizosphaerae]RZS90138.1 sporulation and spore germination protein [Motilibacter rhizosphaerae]